MKFLIVLWLVQILSQNPVHAALPPNATAKKPLQQALTKPRIANVLSAPTAIVGGEAGDGFSLLDVKREIAKSGLAERMTIDVGDIRGKPNFGAPSYYHAQLMKDPARLILDFSQMPMSFLSEKQLAAKLKDSKFVRRVQMTLDPEDQTLSMILDLKPETRIRVLQVKGEKKTSQLLVDFL